MSNTKTSRNIYFAILALFLTVAAFTGCGKNEKTEKESEKTEAFADDLQKGNGVKQDKTEAIKWLRKAAEQDITGEKAKAALKRLGVK